MKSRTQILIDISVRKKYKKNIKRRIKDEKRTPCVYGVLFSSFFFLIQCYAEKVHCYSTAAQRYSTAAQRYAALFSVIWLC